MTIRSVTRVYTSWRVISLRWLPVLVFMMSSFSMLMLALSREVESQLNPSGEKEDNARGTVGVPEGTGGTGITP